jgi:hypothetical protein
VLNGHVVEEDHAVMSAFLSEMNLRFEDSFGCWMRRESNFERHILRCSHLNKKLSLVIHDHLVILKRKDQSKFS